MKLKFKHSINLIFIAISVWPACTLLYAGYTEGLQFRSYEVAKEERTSLNLTSDRKFSLRDYFCLEYDMMLPDSPQFGFGYVCRLVIGESHSLNVLFNVRQDEPISLCVVYDQYILSEITTETEDFRQWRHMKIELLVEKDSLLVRLDGRLLADNLELPRKRSVEVVFGANQLHKFATADVAPIALRNVAVGVQEGSVNYFWRLDRHNSDGMIYDQLHRRRALALNPHWLIDHHTAWQLEVEKVFPGKTFAVFDGRRAIYAVGATSVECIALKNGTSASLWAPHDTLSIENIPGQFLYDEVRERIVCYNFYLQDSIPQYELSYFNIASGEWTRPVRRRTKSTCWQHTAFFSPIDSSLCQMFGYGFHSYRSECYNISLSDIGSFNYRDLKKEIPPRYLCAAGISDTDLYLYGGVGNQVGQQEFGTHIYGDLYRMDMRTGSIIKLWDKGIDSGNEAAVSYLKVEGDKALGLHFCPTRYASYLILKEISLLDGSQKVLGDTISYNFLDIESTAQLCHSAELERLYAVTTHRAHDHFYLLRIYSIACPALAISEVLQTSPGQFSWWLVGGLALLLLCAAGMIQYLQNRKSRKKKQVSPKKGNSVMPFVALEEYNSERTGPGIYLLGGFRVIDRAGRDITGEFTPTMKQILSLIILYTYKGVGISNRELKDFLWFDMSEENARNNRSVNIRKIRLLLERVGEFGLTTQNSYWTITFGQGEQCDYTLAADFLKGISGPTPISPDDMVHLLKIASRGALLPNQQFEWLDAFKADYANMMIGMMARLRDSRTLENNHKARILLSEGILLFDTLDEESVKVKCHALVALGKIGMAKTAFDTFTREYRQLMGEEFSARFDKIIK